MIDWKSRLNTGMRGVVVEGKEDRIVIEAFLNVGEREGYWNDWHSRLAIVEVNGIKAVLAELEVDPQPYDVWAVLDQEWRSQDSMAELQRQYPQLLFLPRVMIENYIIDPDELVARIPSHQLNRIGESTLRQTIEGAVENWLLHGALSQVLHEDGRDDFCKRLEGFPNRLLNPPHAPMTDEAEIESWLSRWHGQLDPQQIMPAYRQRVIDFQSKSASEQYCHCIEGKLFFQQVIVGQILNQGKDKRKSAEWLEELFKSGLPIQCPSDMIPLLTRLLE